MKKACLVLALTLCLAASPAMAQVEEKPRLFDFEVWIVNIWMPKPSLKDLVLPIRLDFHVCKLLGNAGGLSGMLSKVGVGVCSAG